MNVKNLSKEMSQRYIKDIDSSAGVINDYFFTVSPSNLISLVRVDLSVILDVETLVELQEIMAYHRAVGREGIRYANPNLILEIKLNGLDDGADFTQIMSDLTAHLKKKNVLQVDRSGQTHERMGVYRVGTKLEVHSDDTVGAETQYAKERYSKSNQSRFKAYLGFLLIFAASLPLYFFALKYEPPIFGFVFISFAIILASFRYSFKQFQSHWQANTTDLILIFSIYIIGIHVTRVFHAADAMASATSGLFTYSSMLFLVFKEAVFSWGMIESTLMSLVFIIIFNYHVIRALFDNAKGTSKPVKRSVKKII